MEYDALISKLKFAGVCFEPGLSNEEFLLIESTFGFRFPGEIRTFLSCGLPVGGSFFHWRDISSENIQRFRKFYSDLEESFFFDIEHNSLKEMLGSPYEQITDQQLAFAEIMAYVQRSPKLVPFYAHRCFFDGIDNMPIVSFWQPTDIIFYGGSFVNYLEVEFLKQDRVLDDISVRMKDAGIWADLIW